MFTNVNLRMQPPLRGYRCRGVRDGYRTKVESRLGLRRRPGRRQRPLGLALGSIKGGVLGRWSLRVAHHGEMILQNYILYTLTDPERDSSRFAKGPTG